MACNSDKTSGNQEIKFRVSDYISEQLNQNYLNQRTCESLRPNIQFSDPDRLRRALNRIQSIQAATEPQVTVYFDGRRPPRPKQHYHFPIRTVTSTNSFYVNPKQTRKNSGWLRDMTKSEVMMNRSYAVSREV